MAVIKFVVVLLIGYLIGSFNTSIVIGKIRGIDIRKHGSGNAGLTNTYRVLGTLDSVLVIFGDVIKGVLAVYLGKYLWSLAGTTSGFGMLIGGLGAIIGHNFPIYFNFRGGKGILTTGAVLACINIKIALVLFTFFVLVVVVTKYVSLGSVMSAVLLPVVVAVLDKSTDKKYFLIWSIIVMVSALVRHKENIFRLMSGTETQFSLKRKKRKC